jgi:hypothetical protein
VVPTTNELVRADVWAVEEGDVGRADVSRGRVGAGRGVGRAGGIFGTSVLGLFVACVGRGQARPGSDGCVSDAVITRLDHGQIPRCKRVRRRESRDGVGRGDRSHADHGQMRLARVCVRKRGSGSCGGLLLTHAR